MALTFYLFRHATAEEHSTRKADFERYLTSSGIQEAMRMGKYLYDLGEKPQQIIASPSMRTLQTAEMVAEQLHYNKNEIVYVEEIYEASVRIIFRNIHELENSVQSVMFVGHNPAFSYVAEMLSKGKIANMEKAGVAKFIFETDSWQLAGAENAQFVWYHSPSTLQNQGLSM
jgi:phosphohistidine phosphatase